MVYYLLIEFNLILLNLPRMNILKKNIFTFILLSLFFFPFTSFAQEEANDLKAEENISSPIQQLDLELPKITDNPSLIITFSDPSTNKEGVQLEIDKKGYLTIKSPYTFPALSIGDHQLKFKFVDKYAATQTIEKEIIVIPRAPILNTPSVEASKIIFGGSALSGSEVVLLLSTDQKMITKTTDADQDGKWEIEITDNIPTGLYSFTALVRKYGYASNLAQAMTLDISNGDKDVFVDDTKQKIHFAFNSIEINKAEEIAKENPDLVVTFASLFVLGSLLGLLLGNISHKRKENKEVSVVSKSLEKPKDPEANGLTLRDKLISKGIPLDENKNDSIEEEVEQEPIVINEVKGLKEKGDEKIITKIDFLKNFKNEDPDDEKGNEKKVTVSLTSKK